jgi:hypothetical protein
MVAMEWVSMSERSKIIISPLYMMETKALALEYDD